MQLTEALLFNIFAPAQQRLVHAKRHSYDNKRCLLCSSAGAPSQSSSKDLEAAKELIQQDVILRLEHLSPSEMKYTLWLLFVASLIGLAAVLAELSVKVTKVWWRANVLRQRASFCPQGAA